MGEGRSIGSLACVGIEVLHTWTSRSRKSARESQGDPETTLAPDHVGLRTTTAIKLSHELSLRGPPADCGILEDLTRASDSIFSVCVTRVRNQRQPSSGAT